MPSTPRSDTDETAVVSKPRRLLGPEHPVATSVFGAAMVAMLTYLVAARPEAAPEIPPPAAAPVPAETTPEPPTILPAVQRARFFEAEVEPLIVKADQLNREAADRCLKRLSTVFRGYHAGVDPFVNDLTSLSTRLGIVRRMPGNWWRKDNRIQNYVQSKFEKNLFSEKKLMDDITFVLEEFKRDIDANQKRMLIGVRASLGLSDLPNVKVEEYRPFFQSVSQQLQGYAAKQGTTSVMNAVGVFIVSEAGVFAARSVITGLLARFGTAAAVSAAAGAGATGAAAASGAGGGTLAGPVGTAVGFGVGLAVGLVIDWWMTERFEAELSGQMHHYINSLRDSILHGGPTTASTISGSDAKSNDRPGLIEALPVVCDRLKEAYRERFYQQIVSKGTSS